MSGCPVKIKTGQRRGLICGRDANPETGVCWRHDPKRLADLRRAGRAALKAQMKARGLDPEGPAPEPPAVPLPPPPPPPELLDRVSRAPESREDLLVALALANRGILLGQVTTRLAEEVRANVKLQAELMEAPELAGKSDDQLEATIAELQARKPPEVH